MAAIAVASPHDARTKLNYYAPIGDEAPFQYVQDPPAGTPKHNLGEDTHDAVIHDVRGKEDTVGLDRTGFQFIKHESAETEFVDEERIKTVYYKEVEAVLKRETGAKRVFIFDHTIRRPNALEGKGVRGYVERVHIDQTFEASVARVHRHLGADADRVLKGRVRIINFWRPIGHSVAHKSLAVADWRTLDEKDLVPVRFIYPDVIGGTYAVKYNPKLQWYFLKGQKTDEVTLVKCYDSDKSKARLTPHTAFSDDSDPKSAPTRQSIEVRALIFDAE